MKRALLLLLFVTASLAQQWVNPHFDAHRLDYYDLGYPAQNLIPADNSQITALLAHSNGFVYGATSGKTQSYLFFYNRYIHKVRPLGKIANATGVYHTLLEGEGGKIYIGTGLNMFAPVKLTKQFPVEIEAIEKQLWKDINVPYQGYEGGHIYVYDPKTGDTQRYTNDGATPLEDLGIPVKGDSIYAMTMDHFKKKIYGITYPNAHFFVFDLATKQTKDIGEFLEKKVYSGPERHWRSIPRALYERAGSVYTSGENAIILRFQEHVGKFEQTHMGLPAELWEGLSSYDYPVIECFATDGKGNVYAATNDGFIVRLDFQNDETIVLGKPRIQRRVRAMAAGKDDTLYIITGEIGKVCKLHTYDLNGNGGFQELGPLAVDRSPYYQKRAYQFDAIAIGPDGTVFCGESDRRGKLFFYMPGPGRFKGMYNPTNPVVDRMREGTPALIKERL